MTEMQSETYTWSITDPLIVKQIKNSKQGDKFDSPIFRLHGFYWYLRFYRHWNGKWANNAMLYLYLADLPPKVSTIKTYRNLTIVELDSVYTSQTAFDRDNMGRGWTKNWLLTKNVANFNTFTIKCTVTILNIYDIYNNSIKNRYINKNNNNNDNYVVDNQPKLNNNLLTYFESSLNMLSNQINLIEKTIDNLSPNPKNTDNDYKINDNDDIKQDINSLKQSIQLLMNDNSGNDNNLDPHKKEFKDWVNNILQLPQYYNTFIENGIETLNVAQLLTMNELNSCGITLMGHKILIMSELTKLNSTANVSNVQQLEGKNVSSTNR